MSQLNALVALLLLAGAVLGAALELVPGAAPGCPETCRCSASRTRRAADCSGSSLTSVPTGLDVNINVLDLSYNRLTALHNGTLRLQVPALQKLVLSDNDISELELDAFAGLSQLWWLSLENNALHYIHSLSFQGAPKLWKLILTGNPLHMPSDNSAFLIAPELRILELSKCSLFSIPQAALQNLTGLWTLRVDGNDLESVNALRNLPELEVLDLHQNLIRQIPWDSFSTLPRLKHLNLSSNPLMAAAHVPFLNASHLWSLDLSFTNVTTIGRHFFRESPSITIFRITGAQLESVDWQAFSEIPLLEKASLDRNKLVKLDSQTFFNNSQLLELELNDNRLSISGDRPLLQAAALTRLDIAGNPARSFGRGTFQGLPALSVLDAGRCGLEELQPGVLEPLPDLYELRLDRNRLAVLPPDLFAPCQRLAEVNLRGNRLVALPPLPGSPALERLDLGDNRLVGRLPTLPGAPRLRRLLLDGNLLSDPPDQPLEDALPALRELDLRRNPWHCNCTLRPLWRWCHKGEAAAPQGVSRCPEDVWCGPEQEQHWDLLNTLRCEGDPESAESASAHDPNLDVEMVDLSGRLVAA